MLPHEQNSYFIIVQLIQNLILLYFHTRIDTKLLTDEEQYKLFKMFKDNTKPKFIQLLETKPLKLIFKSSGKDMDSKKCIDKVYGRKDILILIHSINDNICGGYTSVGWKKESLDGDDFHVEDENAFIFNIRSSNGFESKVSYVKKNETQNALRHYWSRNYGRGCLMFGSLALYIWQDRTIYAKGNDMYYDALPNKYHFLGQYSSALKEIEVFQFVE